MCLLKKTDRKKIVPLLALGRTFFGLQAQSSRQTTANATTTNPADENVLRRVENIAKSTV
jgi:hypothetical protein